MKIDQEIINQTTKCNENFACLTDKEHHCLKSKVDYSVGEKLIFIHCSNIYCNYRMHFGNRVLCHCPIRKAIYFKYNI